MLADVLNPGLRLTWIFSKKRGKTKIFITNVAKTWFSVISMEKPWKFETRVKAKTCQYSAFSKKNSRFWESFTKKKKKKVVFSDFRKFFVTFGNRAEIHVFRRKMWLVIFFRWQPGRRNKQKTIAPNELRFLQG